MPGTGTLRTLAGFTDPVAAALFERITSVDADTTLRKTVDRLRTFDLSICKTSTVDSSATCTSGPDSCAT